MAHFGKKSLKYFRGKIERLKRIRRIDFYSKECGLDKKILDMFIEVREKILIPLMNEKGEIEITIISHLKNKTISIEFSSSDGKILKTIIHNTERKLPAKYKRRDKQTKSSGNKQ